MFEFIYSKKRVAGIYRIIREGMLKTRISALYYGRSIV